MTDPAGETNGKPTKACRPFLPVRASASTSPAMLVKLTASKFSLSVPPLRQSVFGRLAGYEDVNDAERLYRDRAMRWVVGGMAPMGQAASTARWAASRPNS